MAKARPAQKEEPVCRHCRYWQPKPKRDSIEWGGYCVRFPNPVHKVNSDWCGEFKTKGN